MAPKDAETALPAVDAASPVVTNVDAGPDVASSSCRLVYGPAEQPFRGPAALAASGTELKVIANDSGKPRVYPVAISAAPKGGPPTVPPKPASFAGMRWPPCEVAGRFAYCQGPGGAIVRTTLGSTDAKTIAKARAGTRIAAAPIGDDHSVVAFLDLRRTTEGDMLQAFVALDERDPVRLSDEGAGATTLRFLQRGDTPVALYLDTRTAMVPVHARQLSRNAAGGLALGADTVVFVGGPPERGIDFTVVSAGTKSFALVPMPRETLDFGMAALAVEDPPKEDVSAVWSTYANGLDPAPIAATTARKGGAWVARVVPRGKERGAPRIIELGRLDGNGAFASHGEIASGKGVTDMTLIEDSEGAVWILYGDATVTWLERRSCAT